LASFDYCNFYANNLVDGVLVSVGYGMAVDNCIFRDNIKDIAMTEQRSTNKFNITNCVFSGLFPSESLWFSFGSNNQQNAITMSFVIVGVISQEYCPTNSPTASSSISHTPTGTSSVPFLSSDSYRLSSIVHISPVFQRTGKRSPSAFQYDSSRFRPSSTCFPTVLAEHSPVFRASSSFGPSPSVGRRHNSVPSPHPRHPVN
jgi:hypothetical protein